MPDEEPEVQEINGPDPRTWPGNESLWGLVTDIEMIERVTVAVEGPVAQDGMSEAYQESRRFLRSAGAACREQLALMLLAMYGVKPAQDSGASPFAAAGKPRAFGADTSPPAGNLPSWQGTRQSDGSG